MKKISFVVSKNFLNNNIFLGKGSKIGRFDKFIKLKNIFKDLGYDISTHDINVIEKSDLVLYFDMPKKLPKLENKDKSYLLALESSIIKPENFDFEKHKYFNKIFTWNDDLIDNQKYIKINYAFNFPKKIYKNIQRKKLCCLIVSNKTSEHKNELYSARKKLIRWFEKKHPQDFDLYGFGWNSFRFEGIKPIRALNKIPFLNRLMYNIIGEKFISYRGMVDCKFETMKKYRFSIAYENVKDENSYITEKIFDVMIAGCVPVYWGAKNILDYIPKECFIDRREFETNEELYEFIKNMNDIQYKTYLDNIEKYLNSEKCYVFTSEYFAKTISKHMEEKI